MVTINDKSGQGQPKTVVDAVCPECFAPFISPFMYPESPMDADGVQRRTYSGWCNHCDKPYQVVQFKSSARWIIEKYTRLKTLYVTDGIWVNVNTPGEFPLVQTGPGGEFVKTNHGEKTIVAEAVNKATKALIEIVNMVGELKSSLNTLKK